MSAGVHVLAGQAPRSYGPTPRPCDPDEPIPTVGPHGCSSVWVMGDPATAIYEWGGGRDAFARWLNRFYDLVELEAPEIAAMFGGRVSDEHRAHVTDWWVEVMGGPAAYSERRGGYEHMLARHHDLAITASSACCS